MPPNPQETLTYKVQLDTSDLPEQLQRARQEIDSAVGAVTGSQGGFNPGELLGNLNSSLGNAASSVGQVIDQAQLGYAKAREDLAGLGFLNPTTPDFQLSPNYQRHNLPTNTGAALAGMFGAGYDLSNPLTRMDYRRQSAKHFSEQMGESVANNQFGILSAAIGFGVAGPAGLLAAGVGMGADVLTQILAKDAIDSKEYARDLAGFATAGGFSSDSSAFRDLALEVVQAPRNFDNLATGYTGEMMQANIGAFASGGGFQGVGSVEEMSTKIRKVLDTTNQVAKQLGIFQEEAAKIMGELEQKGVSSLNNVTSFTANMQVMGGLAGMTGTELIGMGMQGMQAAAGTGMGAAAGFNIAAAATVEAGMLSRGNAAQRSMVFDMGGVTNTANFLTNNALNYGESSAGFLQAANIAGGGSYTGDLNQLYTNAASYLGQDPQNYYKLSANQGSIIGGLSPTEIGGADYDKAVSIADTLSPGPHDSDTIVGILMRNLGHSGAAARLLVQQQSSGGGAALLGHMKTANLAYQTQAEMEPGIVGSIGAGISLSANYLTNPFRQIGGGLWEGTSSFISNIAEKTGDFFTGKTRVSGELTNPEQNARISKLIDQGISEYGGGLDRWENYAMNAGLRSNKNAPKMYNQELFESNVRVGRRLSGADKLDLSSDEYTSSLLDYGRKSINWDEIISNKEFETAEELYDTVSEGRYGVYFSDLNDYQVKIIDSELRGNTSLSERLYRISIESNTSLMDPRNDYISKKYIEDGMPAISVSKADFVKDRDAKFKKWRDFNGRRLSGDYTDEVKGAYAEIAKGYEKVSGEQTFDEYEKWMIHMSKRFAGGDQEFVYAQAFGALRKSLNRYELDDMPVDADFEQANTILQESAKFIGRHLPEWMHGDRLKILMNETAHDMQASLGSGKDLVYKTLSSKGRANFADMFDNEEMTVDNLFDEYALMEERKRKIVRNALSETSEGVALANSLVTSNDDGQDSLRALQILASAVDIDARALRTIKQ